ncbi:Uncharacterised protein [Neisseria animaloris]|uniref:HLGFF motif protein n=1 Tax=Neisseria animaloris TaxID=326522 RepID=UPI000A190A4D|nr:hypothetical protein [Neisseria animaloris]OSI08372.1 hypothetical protein BWD08_03895 [Neisseria animaloris]VEH86758.1 Uncharacterised protein [Neisseria animaloris]
MHYFSIHTQAGEHLGFLIMLPDNESENPPQSGRFAVKLQSEQPPQNTAAVHALEPYQNAAQPLYWAVEKDCVALFDDESAIGRIRNEYFSIGGQTLVLNDLTGMV